MATFCAKDPASEAVFDGIGKSSAFVVIIIKACRLDTNTFLSTARF